ncbi:MAG: undecaprenyl/decaprenyl-phosphate alpha-N-acetylglucosaminyl 1-phosphate transferase [Phycisphaerales bacterium]|nr:undecaprenyl/decaprenyl-phosphate alpha-N-acetylglucosaminyl 1-phosphate transferase [Phycisphaerales bacterium]
MELLILILIALSLFISLPATWIIVKLSHRIGALDSAPIEGQIKADTRSIPNTGGIAIALGILIPMICALGVFSFLDADALPTILDPIKEHIPGLKSQLPLGWTLIACLLGLHILGLIDDRKPMGPWLKLIIMLIPGVIFAAFFDTRLMTMLDGYVGGPWLSILITILWFGIIINAMNFIDNMDGLSAGIAIIAGALLLVAALLNGQWFVGAILALLIGSTLGFLIFNFPPAKIFMGDGGSLILGLLLAFLTVRTTYMPIDESGPSAGAWYAVLMPVVILAIPLYDFVSVTLIRLSQGKSPFVGDLQHFSHRIRDRGISSRSTILVIYALTLATGISGLLISRAQPWQAIVLGIQIFALISAIALFEYRSPNKGADE